MRVVNAGDTGAHLETQRRIVTKYAGDTDQMLSGDEDSHLPTVDHDPLDSLRIGRAAADEGTLQPVYDLVEVPSIGAERRGREEYRSHQATEPAGVPLVRDTEHALSRVDNHRLRARPGCGRKVLCVSCIAHASRPFISWVGVAARAADSAAWAAATRLTPSGAF